MAEASPTIEIVRKGNPQRMAAIIRKIFIIESL